MQLSQNTQEHTTIKPAMPQYDDKYKSY